MTRLKQTTPGTQRNHKYLRRLAACAGLIAGLWAPCGASTIAVRSSGEIDVVAQGLNNSLIYYVSLNGNSTTWIPFTIAGAGTTFSEPQIAVRATGEADIVAVGPNNSLLYYSALPGAPWQVNTIATSAYPLVSKPSIAVSNKRADIVWRTAGTVLHYWATPGSAWHSQNLVVNDAAQVLDPAIAVRGTGEIDIVFVTAGGSLAYYWQVPGSPWQHVVLSVPKIYGSPALAVNSSGLAAVAVYDGSCSPGGIDLYTATPGSAWTEYACEVTPAAYPGVVVRSTGEIDVAAAGGPSLFDYLIFWPSGFGGDYPLFPWAPASYTPSIAVSASGMANVAVIAADNSLWYCWALPGGSWSGYKIAGAGTSF